MNLILQLFFAVIGVIIALIQVYIAIRLDRFKTEIWSYVTDIGMFNTADWIIKNAKNVKNPDELLEYWKFEYSPENKKDKYWDKYEKTYKNIEKYISENIKIDNKQKVV